MRGRREVGRRARRAQSGPGRPTDPARASGGGPARTEVRAPRAGPARRLLLAGLVLAVASGCTLTEVTTAESVDVVVVEGLLQRRDDVGFEPSALTVFLHRTIQGDQGRSTPVPGADVRVVVDGTREILLPQVGQGRCVASTPIQGEGTCYAAAPSEARSIAPGSQVRLEVRTPEGEEMNALSIVPGDFELRTAEAGGACIVQADTTLEVVWTPSVGAWAYVNETSIRRLRQAWPDIDPNEIAEPLDLLGLSVSAADTSIVFPAQFGIFDRGDLNQELALRLQQGIPVGTSASISIAAVDRNYINWVRGGNFNPSGQVRVPSVRGDGTGWFGTGVVRSFGVDAGATTSCRTF